MVHYYIPLCFWNWYYSIVRQDSSCISFKCHSKVMLEFLCCTLALWLFYYYHFSLWKIAISSSVHTPQQFLYNTKKKKKSRDYEVSNYVNKPDPLLLWNHWSSHKILFILHHISSFHYMYSISLCHCSIITMFLIQLCALFTKPVTPENNNLLTTQRPWCNFIQIINELIDTT